MASRISNERKNLTRISGELLVASRLAQRGIMIALQWGSTIGYDILAFDKKGNVAYLEVKTSASFDGDWALQAKYANPEKENIPINMRFICCVNIKNALSEPSIYIFPAEVVASGLRYYFNNNFPNSPTYNLPLNKKPVKKSKEEEIQKVGEFINASKYLENFDILGLDKIEI